MDLEYLKARTGQATLSARLEGGRKILLHSAYDPEREANEWAQTVEFGQNEVIVLFGCGLGYAPTALRDRLSRNNHLLILDPLATLLGMEEPEPFRTVLQDPRIQRVATLAELRTAYDKVENACWQRISLLRLPVYERIFPEELAQLVEWTARQANTLKMHRDTVFKSARLWQRNLFRNLVHVPHSGAVSSIFGSFKDKPAIIVSAGPSLTKNMNLLREAQDRALIIATGTAARLLSIEGIPYHLVMSVDPNPVNWTAHFAGVSHDKAVLVYDMVTTPEVVAAHHGPKAAFYSLPDCQWIDRFISRPIGILRTGGSVANIAFDLALRLEADPVILIGQDLAYSGGGLGNAPGTYADRWAHRIPSGWFDKEEEEIAELAKHNPSCAYLLQKGRVSVPGVDGKPIWTDRILYGFLTWFEETIRRLGGKPRVIDATEGGALISGTEVKPLKSVLAEDCPGSVIEEIERVCSRLASPIESNARGLLEYLDDGLRELRALDDRCRRLLELFNAGQPEIPPSLEQEVVQSIEDLKNVLHFSFVPILVRLRDFSSVGSPEWLAVRQSFLEYLHETLRDGMATMEETTHRLRGH